MASRHKIDKTDLLGVVCKCFRCHVYIYTTSLTVQRFDPLRRRLLTGEDDSASVNVCKIGMYEAFNLEVPGGLGRAT